MDSDEGEWRRWNWRSEGDLMVNGAFFVTSGAEVSPQYAEATSMAPFAANVIEQLTMNAGVTGLPRYEPDPHYRSTSSSLSSLYQEKSYNRLSKTSVNFPF